MRRLPLMPAAYTVSQPSASVPSRPRRDLQIVASLTPNAEAKAAIVSRWA
jgi:hypothetical protein